MSAPRRTPTKTQPGSSATVAPRSTAPGSPPAPASQRPPKAGDKTKGVQQAQPSVFAKRTESVRRLARDTWSEMKKVNWPDKDTTRNLTFVVIAISIILGLLLGGIDFALVKLLDVF